MSTAVCTYLNLSVFQLIGSTHFSREQFVRISYLLSFVHIALAEWRLPWILNHFEHFNIDKFAPCAALFQVASPWNPRSSNSHWKMCLYSFIRVYYIVLSVHMSLMSIMKKTGAMVLMWVSHGFQSNTLTLPGWKYENFHCNWLMHNAKGDDALSSLSPTSNSAFPCLFLLHSFVRMKRNWILDGNNKERRDMD